MKNSLKDTKNTKKLRFKRELMLIKVKVSVRYIILLSFFMLIFFCFIFCFISLQHQLNKQIKSQSKLKYEEEEPEDPEESSNIGEDIANKFPDVDTLIKSYRIDSEEFYDEKIFQSNDKDSIEQKNNNKCFHTTQGELSTDSRGNSCMYVDLDQYSGCCEKEKSVFSCESCTIGKDCCKIFEFCVACCMDPLRRKLILEVLMDNPEDKLFQGVENVFQYCSLRCRTSSESVVNEKFYRDSNKYCFGRFRKKGS